MKKYAILVLLLGALLLGGCLPAGPGETSAPTETAVPTESAAPTETAAPTESVAPTETAEPTETAAPTETTAPAGIRVQGEGFSFLLPESWEGRYVLQAGASVRSVYWGLYEKGSYDQMQTELGAMGGHLVTLELRTDGEEAVEYPEWRYLGVLRDPEGGSLDLLAWFPTDVQFTPAGEADYREMSDDIEAILASITPDPGYTWEGK